MPKKIMDRFTNLPVTRQRKSQLRKAAKGMCWHCGGPLNGYSDTCQVCLGERKGTDPWKPGSPGPIPRGKRRKH